ncbi:hypothetical protein CKO50_09325 [Pseudoalteromonas sp. HM-SA03]|uniref:DUF3549 family protein n=1 Tax=Pseudoalteromonas sp. HM-SA03 TaxID=2029678 RepID=UPI000BADF559|nr:DUF3549 family protein [Pseudoalteromonas sp. HM-SA03]PAY01525.1 hypothetical protein CKO50_09325 [Pseudoalteromonas sp. HM-SA03]
MTAQISTLGELLTNAGTQWRVYDMGRRITKIDKKQFAQIESAQVPYPYPLGGHAIMAIQFWDNEATADPYVWFLKFPLDEQSKLIIASRDHFASMVLEALGTQLTGEAAQGKLDNNPYVFTPNANKLAAFNALLKRELNRPASQYYEHAELYFSRELGFERWQEIALQGIADFALRLDHGHNASNLQQAWSFLPAEVKTPLAAMLEHVTVSTSQTEDFLAALNRACQQQNKDAVVTNLRAMSGSHALGLIAHAVDAILASELGADADCLLTIAGRAWETLTDQQRLFIYMEKAAENNQIDGLFGSIFADLVAIPMLRPHVLGIIRAENRSETLSRAIGRLFS